MPTHHHPYHRTRRPLAAWAVRPAALLAALIGPVLTAGPASAAEHHEPAPKAAAHAPKAHAETKQASPAGPSKTTPPSAASDTLEQVRERLSDKLGAQKAKDGKTVYVLHNTAQSPGDVRVAATPRGAAAGGAHGGAHGGGKAHGTGAHAAGARAAGHAEAHWSYAGEGGPQSWGSMKPDFATCSTGQRQSPIDIREGIAVELEPVRFDYRASNFSVIDNGHTVQVNLAAGNGIEVLGRRYELLQFHFHRPSEERIGGRQFDMVVHLVHKDAEGRLAVVAVLLDRGSVQPIVQTVWNNLPLEKNEAQPARVMLDPTALLPTDRRYYTYMGSLTTPPCSEGVLWMVLKNPVSIAPEQIDIFAKLYPMNARPVQPTAGRLIKQSN